LARKLGGSFVTGVAADFCNEQTRLAAILRLAGRF
jgi:hypothetical protein